MANKLLELLESDTQVQPTGNPNISKPISPKTPTKSPTSSYFPSAPDNAPMRLNQGVFQTPDPRLKTVTSRPVSQLKQPQSAQEQPETDNPLLRLMQDPNVNPAQKEAATRVMADEVERQKGALEKTSDFFENYFLKPGTKLIEKGQEAMFGPITGKAVKFGQENLPSMVEGATKPFLQPGVALSHQVFGTGDLELPLGTKVKAEPTPGDLAWQAAETAAYKVPVEKLVAPVLKPIGSFIGGIAKRLGGALTGKGTDVIEEILKNPKAAKVGLRGEETAVLENMAKEAKSAVSTLRKEMQNGYKKMLETLPTQEKMERMSLVKKSYEKGDVMGKAPEQLTKVPGYEETPLLTRKGLKTFVTKRLNDFNVIVDRAKEKLSFSESPLRKSEENILREVFKVVNEWTDMSPAGVDRLAIKIGNYKGNGEQTKMLDSIIGGLKKDIRGYIGDRYPQIKKGVAEYAEKADVIETLESILNVGPMNSTKEVLDTAKKIQNLFSGQKSLERELLKSMGMEDIVATEAGRQLAQAPSRASASIGDTARNVVQTVISPKAIGEATAFVGENLKPVMDTIKKLAPTERVALFNVLKGLVQNEDSSDLSQPPDEI